MGYFHSSHTCSNNQYLLFFLSLIETKLTHLWSLLTWQWSHRKRSLLKSILTITLWCIITSHRLSVIRHCAINISSLIRIITQVRHNSLAITSVRRIRLSSIQRLRLPILRCSIDTSLRYNEWLTHIILVDLCTFSRWFRRKTTHLIIFLF